MTRKRKIDRKYVKRIFRNVGLLQETADICKCHVSSVRDIVIEAGLHEVRPLIKKVGRPIAYNRDRKLTVGEDLLLQRLRQGLGK